MTPPGESPPEELPETLTPAPPSIRRLTQEQYRNSVRDVLGVEVQSPLEPDSASNGFLSVGAARTTISQRGVDLYETAAYEAAQAFVTETRASDGLGCQPGVAACLESSIARYGRLLWRRPMTEAELERYLGIAFQAQGALRDMWAGIEFAVAGMLQSPNFLFRAEIGSGETVAEGRAYDDFEMASRISFAICNTSPSDSLLDAAERGELTDDETLREHVESLVASDCARESVRSLFDEIIDLRQLPRMEKDESVYPQATETLGAALRESLLTTVERWVFEDALPYRDFYTRSEAAVNEEVAALYGVSVPDEPASYPSVDLDDRRGGLLTHGAVLARHSHGEATSPTLRGKFVRTFLLCQTIPPPPDDVGELPEPNADALTLRERLASHRENPACANCHALMDPIGLALENFDGVGAFRETENGVDIDASGELDGETYPDAIGLGQALSTHEDLADCFVRNLYRHTTGHIETPGERRTIMLLQRGFEEEQQITDLLVELVMSEGFRTVGEAE